MLVFHHTPFHQLHLKNETEHYGQTEGFHFANGNKWVKIVLLVIRSITKIYLSKDTVTKIYYAKSQTFRLLLISLVHHNRK